MLQIYSAFQGWRRVAWIVVVGGALALSANAAGNRFGEIVRLSGEVRAQDVTTGAVRKLTMGDSLFVGERIEASDHGEAVIRTADAGVVALRPKVIFYLQAFRAEPVPESRFDLRLVRGSLRLITGWIGVRNKANYSIQTPTAIVGIRGTDQEPYVMSADLAVLTGAQEGTYNKVNSGGVLLQSATGHVVLSRGQAGFVPVAPKVTTRGLMTALIPVLLDKVPNFYLPGKFDENLEQYAEQELSRALNALPFEEETSVSAAGAGGFSASEVAVASASPSSSGMTCKAESIARHWLSQLDRALELRDPQRFVDLFSADVRVTARTRLGNGELIETRLTREEFIQSTFTSLNQLNSVQSHRPKITARILDGAACRRVEVVSTVLERGIIAGRSYQLESQEIYELQLDKGIWRAWVAQTTQN